VENIIYVVINCFQIIGNSKGAVSKVFEAAFFILEFTKI
jgi:hypothetical protein